MALRLYKDFSNFKPKNRKPPKSFPTTVMGSDPNVVQTAWKYIRNPSQSPSTRTHTSFRHLHFPTKKAPANQVTDAFVNIIIPVQNNLSSQVPHPGPRRTIIPRNTEGQPSIFQNNRSHRNHFSSAAYMAVQTNTLSSHPFLFISMIATCPANLKLYHHLCCMYRSA